MKEFASRLTELFIDFIFPKSDKVLVLERFLPEQILNTLPRAEKTKDENVLAIFDYRHRLTKELIWELKYKGNKIVARNLGTILYDEIAHELSEKTLFDATWKKAGQVLLVPIPISDKRRLERGWNQTETLAEELIAQDIEKIFKYLPRQLVKIRHTESQTTTSSKKERLENIKESMKVLDTSAILGKCVVLIDDVTTTGATFNEACRVLKMTGAKRIICFALAH